MTDHTNDIEQLLRWLDAYDKSIPQSQHRWHAALVALVAERDELKQRVAELEAHKSVSVRLLIEERAALRKRVSYLEALSKPLYIPHGQRVESIDLRERLVCAALRGLCGDHSFDLDESVFLAAVAIADRTLAAMRKGATDGK